MAQLENVINLPEAPDPASTTIPPLYFCIPNNPTLLQYWDTVADRLFKIRHCMTIEGVVQQLPLFEPPINPALLVAARAGGVSISAALASLATPAPHYRFAFLMQKAVEYCQVVKGLGNQLLAAYEKRDAEALGLLRAKHEESLLKASTELKNLQVDEARENLAALERSKLLVEERIEYYSNLEKRSEKEKAAVRSLDAAEEKRVKASDKERSAARSNLIPNISVSIPGPSGSTSYGGSNLGSSLSADAAKFRGESESHTYQANKLSTDASYDRRSDDWKLQERLARKELKQVEKQIIAAQIRLALAEKERDNHAIQLEQSREVKDFLTGKFSNEELYGWMISQTSAIYFQSYKLAYDLAKRCEKAHQRETGEYSSAYIAYGYFDSMKKGLLAGDRLHHDLQRMEFDLPEQQPERVRADQARLAGQPRPGGPAQLGHDRRMRVLHPRGALRSRLSGPLHAAHQVGQHNRAFGHRPVHGRALPPDPGFQPHAHAIRARQGLTRPAPRVTTVDSRSTPGPDNLSPRAAAATTPGCSPPTTATSATSRSRGWARSATGA